MWKIGTGFNSQALRPAVTRLAQAGPASPAMARSLHSVPSLDRTWSPAFEAAMPVQAGRALKSLTGASTSRLRDFHGFSDTVRQLNAVMHRDPLTGAGPCRLESSELLGLSLAVVQAGKKLNIDLDTPDVASLMVHLLSAMPVPEARREAIAKAAPVLVAKALPTFGPLIDERRWWQADPATRASILQSVLSSTLPVASTLDVGPATTATVRLEISGATSMGAAFGAEKGDGVLTLDRRLLGKRPDRNQALGPALALVNILHELLHGWQHSKLDRLAGDRGYTVDEWAETLRYALSLCTQGTIYERELDTDLLVCLPHEQEAWAMSFHVIRAMLAHPQVPTAMKDALRDFVVNTFDRLAPLVGLAATPRTAASTGRFWDDHRQLAIQPEPPAPAVRQAKIAEFMAGT